MIREIAAIVRKDLKQAKRDPRFMAPSLIIPFVFLLVYVVMWNSVGGGESFACGLVIQDTSPQADDMANIIENMVSTTNHTWFEIERYDLATASQLYLDTQLISYILIPDGFGANISSGQKAKVVIFINNANDDVVKNYVHRIEAAVFLYNQGAVYPDFDQSGARISLDESFSLQATPSNVSYMAAVGILLSLMTCSIAGQALLTASEFETGAIQDTLNSPVSRVALVIGRTISAIPRSFAVLLITVPVICLSLGVFPIGNLLVLTGILLLTVFAMVPIGELIGMKTKKREQALLVSVLITVMAFLGGGGIAPIGLIPASLRTILELIPMTYSFSLWTRVFFLDTVLGLWKGSLFLIATWIVMSVIVALLLKREVERI